MVLIAWAKAKGVVVVTTSSKQWRLEDYLKAGDLALATSDESAIDEAGAPGKPRCAEVPFAVSDIEAMLAQGELFSQEEREMRSDEKVAEVPTMLTGAYADEKLALTALAAAEAGQALSIEQLEAQREEEARKHRRTRILISMLFLFFGARMVCDLASSRW
jgi:hypothetical protein